MEALPKSILINKTHVMQPGRGLPRALIVLCLVSIGVSLAFPAGFAGWDDLHYIQAAQRWLSEGVHVPANHWGTRLPYVWVIAASIRLFGVSVLALTVANTILFTLMLVLIWRIARAVFDPRTALCSTLVAATTPLFLRMPTTYYPEVMEIVFACGATLLAVQALSRPSGPARTLLLLAAGLIGGSGILVRQTALAVPLALSLLIWLTDRARPRRAMGSIVLLGIGYAVPVLLESLFYFVMTGDPLGRLRIDSRHVLIPSAHLRGGTFTGGSPLFNWSLAARWDVPSLIRVHWTINPLLRVFTSPGLLLTPWLCLVGSLLVLRLRGFARSYAIFVGAGFLGQYILNTFILVIAPDTRYFAVSIALAMPLAGFLLAHLRRVPAFLVGILLLMAPCLVVMSVEPAPAHVMPALRHYVVRGEPVYVSRDLLGAAAILFADHPQLARNVHLFTDRRQIPVGDLTIIDAYGWADGSPTWRCANGGNAWQSIESAPASSLDWIALEKLGLAGLVPVAVADRLKREQDRLTLVKRAC